MPNEKLGALPVWQFAIILLLCMLAFSLVASYFNSRAEKKMAPANSNNPNPNTTTTTT